MADQVLIIKEWIKDKLKEILLMDIPDEMASYILSIKDDAAVDRYFKELLNFKDIKTRRFVAEYMKRRKTQPVSRKKFNNDETVGKNSKNTSVITEDKISFDASIKKHSAQDKQNSSKGNSNTKKKNKYVNFYAKGGEAVLLKGRYQCDCEASIHKLINNCLSCGRIVCEQEGSGPCFFCDTLVCTPEEQMIFNGDTSEGSKLYESLLLREKPKQKGLDEAMSHRDKLLEFDKNSKKHTHVFDDDSDYYCSANPWLTIEEREKCKQKEEDFFSKKNESRLNKSITLKFNGLKLVEEEKEEKPICSTINEEDVHKNESVAKISRNEIKLDSIDHLLDPYFNGFKAKYKDKLKKTKFVDRNPIKETTIHVYDYGLQQMTDEGYCISIHQPWASFLANGIRTVEGRTWYTSYRGKLWIASTGLRISRQDAITYENTYRLMKGDIKFPADYPSGCLLGCGDLINCLTQEQYRCEYPDGELEDPYIFIFENCQTLPVRYPMKGKPNIYKLDDKIHTAAKMCLRTVEKVLTTSEQKVKSLRP